MSDKLNIANEMRQFDRKNRSFYDELTDEERKKFSTFIMLRWASAIQSSNNKNFTHDDIASYYIQVLNLRANKHFWSLSRHPKLQWLSATTVSPGMGTQRHQWIAPKKKDAPAKSIWGREKTFESLSKIRIDTIKAMPIGKLM